MTVSNPFIELFSEQERNAWLPPENLKPSQWAEKYRFLPQGKSHRPGLWRNEYSPYLTGIMDASIIPGVVEINIIKPSQVGCSEAIRNVIGYFAWRFADPVGLTLPSQNKGRKIVSDYVHPIFEESSCFQSLLTGSQRDLQSEEIRLLNGFILHLMWAGSASSLASFPLRMVINDEIDLFADVIGGEIDPVQLASVRTTTYGDKGLVINVSTPTTREGQIIQLVEASNYRFYYCCPCPVCGHFQRLQFSNLHWEKKENERTEDVAFRIKRTNEIWYECVNCKAHIEPSQKAEMVKAGRWTSEDGSIEDLSKVQRFPRRSTIGFHLGGLECLWLEWCDLASEFLLSKDSLEGLFNFRTKRLGEVFEYQVSKLPANVYEEKSSKSQFPEGTLPDWVECLIGSVDTQKDSFYLVIRGYAAGYPLKSARIFHRHIKTFEEIEQWAFKHPWGYTDPAKPARIVDLCVIDSGGSRFEDVDADTSRTVQVYNFVLPRQSRCKAIKGMSVPRAGHPYYQTKGMDKGPPIWLINTQHYQDELHQLISAGISDGMEERWFLNQNNDIDYNRQMSNVHKISIRKGLTTTLRWEPIGKSVQVHFRDCEVYNLCGAYIFGVHLLPSAEAIQQLNQNLIKQQEEHSKKTQEIDTRWNRWKPQPFRRVI